jgi:hypothetical protein
MLVVPLHEQLSLESLDHWSTNRADVATRADQIARCSQCPASSSFRSVQRVVHILSSSTTAEELRFRSDAAVSVLVATSRNPLEMADPLGATIELNEFVSGLDGRVTIDSIGGGGACTVAPEGWAAASARTGGTIGSTCSGQTIDGALRAVSTRNVAAVSPFTLPADALAHSVEVYVDNVQMSQGWADGYVVRHDTGTIAFFGASRPAVGFNGGGAVVSVRWDSLD